VEFAKPWQVLDGVDLSNIVAFRSANVASEVESCRYHFLKKRWSIRELLRFVRGANDDIG